MKNKEKNFKKILRHVFITCIIPAAIFTAVFMFNMWLFSIPWYIRDIELWLNAILTMGATGLVSGVIVLWFEDDDFASWIYEGIAAVMLLVFIILALTGAKMFNAEKYKNFVSVEEASVNTINELSEETPIVDMQVAQHLGNREAGNIRNAAWYEVDDEYNMIVVNGTSYRVSPLSYGGIFKYHKAYRDGIPGYVMVNDTTEKAEYVELEKAIRYSPSAMLSHDLTRHVKHAVGAYSIGKHQFELDEQGNPYWVTELKKSQIGFFAGQRVVAFAVTNAVTGEVTVYEPESLPTWVDHAYSLEYLMNTTAWHYKFVRGFWNAGFSKTDVKYLTYEFRDGTKEEEGSYEIKLYNTIITKDGNTAFCTGLTPASNAESNVGFIIADTRTGKISHIPYTGAEEVSAKRAAESKVQDFGYEASFPIVAELGDNNLVYFITLKDVAGLPQRYAIVDVKNYSHVYMAETMTDVIEAYREGENVTDKANDGLPVEAATGFKGVIVELQEVVIDGNTHYFIGLDSGKIFDVVVKDHKSVVFAKVGDTFEIAYVGDKIKSVSINGVGR